MAEDDEKITTEPEESQKKKEECEKNQLNIEPPVPPPPAPKKRAANKPTIVEIPVDAPAPAPPAPVLERATSSAPAAKARGRPKGAVGAAKRAARRSRRAAPDAEGGLQPRGSHDSDAPTHPANAGGMAHGGQEQIPELGELKCTPHVNERLPGGSSERKDPRAHHATTRLRCSPPDEHGPTEAEERNKTQPDCSAG